MPERMTSLLTRNHVPPFGANVCECCEALRI